MRLVIYCGLQEVIVSWGQIKSFPSLISFLVCLRNLDVTGFVDCRMQVSDSKLPPSPTPANETVYVRSALNSSFRIGYRDMLYLIAPAYTR
jgi:hypothetical protein